MSQNETPKALPEYTEKELLEEKKTYLLRLLAYDTLTTSHAKQIVEEISYLNSLLERAKTGH